MSNDQTINMPAIPATKVNKPELPALAGSMTQPKTPSEARTIQSRKVKIWPALIRFFHNSAMAGGPVDRSVNGGRLGLRFVFVPRQLPARTAAVRSASFFEASTEASSKATFERMTHP